jgi:hypothetical protein
MEPISLSMQDFGLHHNGTGIVYFTSEEQAMAFYVSCNSTIISGRALSIINPLKVCSPFCLCVLENSQVYGQAALFRSTFQVYNFNL